MNRTDSGRRVATLCAILTSGALLATGCSGQTIEPKTTPSSEDSSSSPGPSSSPSASASPSVPAELTDAQAFVKRYIDVMNAARKSGDSTELANLSDPKCESCTGTVGLITNVFTKGGSFKGDPSWHPIDVAAVPKTNPQVVTASVKIAAHTIIAWKGHKPVVNKAGTEFFEFTLARKDDSWIVKEWVKTE